MSYRIISNKHEIFLKNNCRLTKKAGWVLFCLFSTISVFAQSIQLKSPNQKIKLSLVDSKTKPGEWSLTVGYYQLGTFVPVIPSIALGLLRDDQSFTDHLKFIKVSSLKKVTEKYAATHGKRSICQNEASEITAELVNIKGKKINIVLRAYNDGIAFRYVFPDRDKGTYRITGELTSYQLPEKDERWLQRFNTAYEGPYPHQDTIKSGEWGYPALIKTGTTCWSLITESAMDGSYCATKLSNKTDKNNYKLSLPAQNDGNSIGDVDPKITLPWASPWRVVILGQLSDIFESTLVEDLSVPAKIKNTEWIRPGASAWVYWGYNHGTKDFKKVCEYIDLAARMGWRYNLLDWEWDQMANGGNLEDAVKYADSKGIKTLMWYNSGGKHNQVASGPRDRLITHKERVKEFSWLHKIGVAGIKVDFFESDKQDMMKYYLCILEDAAQYQLMVDFHGCTIPRGWSRTYPNLMSMEAVFGGEQYNNGTEMTTMAAEHNSTLPFTRNVVGPMDYTPVTFTNSQHPHTTTFAHELALSVIFESAIQHFADRPEGYDSLPDAPKEFLRHVPTAWDDTKLIDGYPGKKAVIARRFKGQWYVGGINGLKDTTTFTLSFNFLPADKKYRLTVISDGDNEKSFSTQYLSVTKKDTIAIKCLPQGGFVESLSLQ